MPLTKCPDCGSDVSTEAFACPKCGRQIAPASNANVSDYDKAAGKLKRVFGGLAAMFVILFLVHNCGTPNDTSISTAASSPPRSTRNYTLTTDSSPTDSSSTEPHSDGTKASSVRSVQAAGTRPKTESQEMRDYMVMTDNVPACPTDEEIKTLMSTAGDKTAWPQAQELGEEEGCIELVKGQHVFPLDTEMFSALIQVRPEGSPDAYWTDMLAVK